MVLARSGRTRLPKIRSSPVYRRTQYQPSICVTTASVEPAHKNAADEYRSLVSCCKLFMITTFFQQLSAVSPLGGQPHLCSARPTLILIVNQINFQPVC